MGLQFEMAPVGGAARRRLVVVVVVLVLVVAVVLVKPWDGASADIGSGWRLSACVGSDP